MLTQEEIQHVALLARIGIKEKEADQYRETLSGVLDFFKDLETANTENIAVPRNVIGRENGMRSDSAIARYFILPETVMQNVPETKDGFVTVKSIL